jgi:hypothetical protein
VERAEDRNSAAIGVWNNFQAFHLVRRTIAGFETRKKKKSPLRRICDSFRYLSRSTEVRHGSGVIPGQGDNRHAQPDGSSLKEISC